MGVKDACRPRPDVLQTELDDAIFAAEFGDVISEQAPPVYQDPAQFFDNTHPAKELCRVARVVFERLADTTKQGGLVRLSTGYGGGKSHTLIALWHIAKHVADPDIGAQLVPPSSRPSKVSVVAVDARKAGVPTFAIHGNLKVGSLAGEIAYQMGGRAAVEALGEADHPEGSPPEEQIAAAFPKGPVLILLDELVVYMAKLSQQGQGNLMGYLGALSGIVARRPQTVLVVTDPAHQRSYSAQATQLDEALRKQIDSASKLDDILGRRFSDYDPIGDESASVIARRLFEHIDESAAKEQAAIYRNLYRRVREERPDLIPPRATSDEYAEDIRHSYPFHPRLMETARGRLGSLEDFQKSRGVLRLFARILRDIWERDEDLPLITAGDVNFSDARVRADLLDRLNRDRFSAVVTADLEHHAVELDGDTKGRGIHLRAASAVLLDSLPMDNNAGLGEQDLTLAVLRPDEAGPEPVEAMQELESVCWHLYPRNEGGWVFRYQPNVLKQIEERMMRVPEEDARNRVHAEVEAFYSGPLFSLARWPQAPHDVRESARLQLALVDDPNLARRIAAYQDDRDPNSTMPRRFLNSLVVVTIDKDTYHNAIDRARRLIALEEIETNARKRGDEDESTKLILTQIDRLKPQFKKQFAIQARRAFSQVVLPNALDQALPLEERYLGSEKELLTQSQGQKALQEFLLDKKKIYAENDALEPDFFVDHILSGIPPNPDDGTWTARAVHERILSAPGLRLIGSDGFVRKSILRAVDAGKLVLRTPDGSAYDHDGAVVSAGDRRTRVAGKAPSSFPLDDKTLLVPPNSAAAEEWLRVSGPGEPPPPPPPPPPGEPVRVRTRDDIRRLADHPLRELLLKAVQPEDAASLARLAQPLGANVASMRIRVKGTPAARTGTILFEVMDLPVVKSADYLVLAEQVHRYALGDESREYEATCVLTFGESGRLGFRAQLEGLLADAPDSVLIEALFLPLEEDAS